MKKKNILEDGNDANYSSDDEDKEIEDEKNTLKRASKRNFFRRCRQSGVVAMTKFLGITSRQCAENLSKLDFKNIRNPADLSRFVQSSTLARLKETLPPILDFSKSPIEVAEQFKSNMILNAEGVVKTFIHMMAREISAEPLLWSILQQVFEEVVTLSTETTSKGRKEVTVYHEYFECAHIQEKPMRSFRHRDGRKPPEGWRHQYLIMLKAQRAGLITIKLNVPMRDLQLLLNTVFMKNPNAAISTSEELEWDSIRKNIIEEALKVHLIPAMKRITKDRLLKDARDDVLTETRLALRKSLEVRGWAYKGPPTTEKDRVEESFNKSNQRDRRDDPVEHDYGFEAQDFDTSKGIRVLALAMGDRRTPTFIVALDEKGDVVDQKQLPDMNKSTQSSFLDTICNFIETYRPHLMVLDPHHKRLRFIRRDLEEQWGIAADRNNKEFDEPEMRISPRPQIHVVADELPTLYSMSKRSLKAFPDYHKQLRYAIGMARFVQNPLVEISQLWTPGPVKEILALRLHPLQTELSHEIRLGALEQELMISVNEVGVDLQKCCEIDSHLRSLLIFVCGLGPRKAIELCGNVRKLSGGIQRRSDLRRAGLGDCVFENAAGFIRVVADESSDRVPNQLDTTRIHPSDYDTAFQMCKSALTEDGDDDSDSDSSDDEDETNPEAVEARLEKKLDQVQTVMSQADKMIRKKKRDAWSKYIEECKLHREKTQSFGEVNDMYVFIIYFMAIRIISIFAIF